MFEQKLHASLNSLLFTQEKLTITKDIAKDLDQLFAYPCWLEFTDEANQVIFDKILEGKLPDEQIDYFLGASDHITHYDQWFKVIKHILKTTHDSHTFWPTGKFRQTELLPKWLEDHVNVRGATGATHDETDDILVPNTGHNTIVVTTASGCTMCITFIIATSTIRFLRRRKN